MGAITVFRDADDPPCAEIVLDNGERVGLTVMRAAFEAAARDSRPRPQT